MTKSTAGMIGTIVVVLLAGQGRAGDVTKVPGFDQFVVIPLRVHVLMSKELELTDGQISDAEVRAMVPAINAIWGKAGITFGLESIVREPAAQLDRFQAIVTLNNGQLDDVNVFAYLFPPASRAFDGLHVYIFHELPINGFCLMAADAAVTKEKPDLNQVPGGSQNALARVAARGLGQALGLPVREDQVGLLSRGTNGVGLGEAETGRARQVAKTVPGAQEVDALADSAAAAAKQGDITKARRFYTWLADVPGTGPGATDAKKQLAALPPAQAK